VAFETSKHASPKVRLYLLTAYFNPADLHHLGKQAQSWLARHCSSRGTRRRRNPASDVGNRRENSHVIWRNKLRGMGV